MKSIKISGALLDAPFWRKPRVFTESEAFVDCHIEQGQCTLYSLARKWGWHHTQVKRFLAKLADMKCAESVHIDVHNLMLKINALQNICAYDCAESVHILKEKEKQRKKEAKKEIEKNKENNNPLLSNESIPLSPFAKFESWVLANAPRVAQMKEPFTEEQFTKAKEAIGWEMMVDLLLQMHNWQNLIKQNTSAYLTLLAWSKRERKVPLKERDNGHSKDYRFNSKLGSRRYETTL